jgi:hypothetical protein
VTLRAGSRRSWARPDVRALTVGHAMRGLPARVPWHRVVNGRGTISPPRRGSGALSSASPAGRRRGSGSREAGSTSSATGGRPGPRSGPVRRVPARAAQVIPPAAARVQSALQTLGVECEVIVLSRREPRRTRRPRPRRRAAVAVGQIVKSPSSWRGGKIAESWLLLVLRARTRPTSAGLGELSGPDRPARRRRRRAGGDRLRVRRGAARSAHPRALRVFIDRESSSPTIA